jgi:hypothetical protein
MVTATYQGERIAIHEFKPWPFDAKIAPHYGINSSSQQNANPWVECMYFEPSFDHPLYGLVPRGSYKQLDLSGRWYKTPPDRDANPNT